MSASATPSAFVTAGAVYETLLPPAYPVTEDSRGAYVLLTAVVMIVITGITVAIKLQMTLSTYRKVRRDDIAILAALIFAVAYTITICRAVEYGLGRTASELTSTQRRLLSEHYYAASVFVWMSMACSKCAVALLVLALQPPKKWIIHTLWAVAGTSALWGVAATFVTAFQCGPDRSVLGPTATDTCIDQYGAQIGIRLVDIVLDIVLCLLPGVLMMYVQVTNQRRLVVSAMFATRVATPVFSAVALSQFSQFYDTRTQNRPLAAVDPSIWTCMTLNASLLTACLPSIKRVLMDWAAGFSNAGITEPFELQYSSNQGRSGQVSGTPRLQASNQRSHNASKAGHETDGAAYGYYLREGRDNSERSDDTESKRGLTDGIMQTTDYMVEYEENGQKHGKRSSSRTS